MSLITEFSGVLRHVSAIDLDGRGEFLSGFSSGFANEFVIGSAEVRMGVLDGN